MDIRNIKCPKEFSDYFQEICEYLNSVSGQPKTPELQWNILSRRKEFMDSIAKYDLKYLFNENTVKTEFQYSCLFSLLTILKSFDLCLMQFEDSQKNELLDQLLKTRMRVLHSGRV